ncbi:MAG: DUF3048 domain-containing protein, partial [Eubacteriales bacterium]
KRMKKIIITAIILLLVFSVFACSNTGNQQNTASAQSSGGVGATAAISSATPSASAAATKSGPVSPTTGLPGNTLYRPIQVQIDNEATGRPQYGIQDADIVYEAEIEPDATRLSAIFNDTLPTKVGPVRSARVYFQWIENEWDSIFVHDGGANNKASTYSYVGSAENGGDMKKNIDAGKGVPENIMWGGGVKPTWANLQAVEETYGYKQTPRSPLFKFDQNVDYSKYPSFSKVDIPFRGTSPGGDHQVSYTYDKSTDLLTRYNFGNPFLAGDTGKVVTVQNLIVQYVEESDIMDGATHQLLGLINNKGKAEFFVGGKHMTGTWSKKDRHAATIFKLDDGSELVLKPGNTWFALQRNTNTITVTDASGTTASASASASATSSSNN